MPGTISQSDQSYLRTLAQRLAEIGAHPRHEERRQWWLRHNRLESVKPMVLVFPEGSWSELLPDSETRIEDPFWQSHEWFLKYQIYRWEHLADDNVIEPHVLVRPARSMTGWGMSFGRIDSATPRGAWKYDPPIKNPDDVAKLQQSQYTYDEDETAKRTERTAEMFGDLLEIRIDCGLGVNTSLVNTVCYLRGLENVMIDMVERPKWLHELFEFLTVGTEKVLDEAEKSGQVRLNNGDNYVGSGGVGYTDELPGAKYDGKPRLKNLWGFAESQEYTGVSPTMYYDFAVQYQAKLLERFGLNCYGCCEDMTTTLDTILDGIPNLRRISISAFTDTRTAAEKLQNRYVFSWKPNPAHLASPTFDEAFVREYIQGAIDICQENGCVLEMILKDTHTCRHQPERFERWIEIAQELSQN